MDYITLRNGVKMPQLGYGVYQVTKEECERCVLDALEVGYRHIDTAQSYFNEEEVGNAIERSGIPREELFITTKVWIEHYGYEEAKKSVYGSMRKLKVDYIDLVLLHQPFSDYYGAWRALEDLYADGKIRAIGISNFYPDRVVDICNFARIAPMVNQVETHPYNQQVEAQKWLDKYGVRLEAWRHVHRQDHSENRRKVRQVGCAGDTALGVATRNNGHSQVRSRGKNEAKFRRVRLRAYRRGHGGHGEPRQKAKHVLFAYRSRHGRMVRKDGRGTEKDGQRKTLGV